MNVNLRHLPNILAVHAALVMNALADVMIPLLGLNTGALGASLAGAAMTGVFARLRGRSPAAH